MYEEQDRARREAKNRIEPGGKLRTGQSQEGSLENFDRFIEEGKKEKKKRRILSRTASLSLHAGKTALCRTFAHPANVTYTFTSYIHGTNYFKLQTYAEIDVWTE